MSNYVANDLKEYSALLEEYSKLPKTRRERTFMEIAGRSHLENPVSNILAFYLNPGEIHGMGRLVLDSLLELIDPEFKYGEATPGDQSDYEEYVVTREESTEARKRMDIIVKGRYLILGIEVKVNHHANNNFSEYSKHLDEISGGSIKPHKLILGKNKIDNVLGFKSITYDDLWESVFKKIDANKFNDNKKWHIHLQDFIQQTKNFNSLKTPMNNATITFFATESKRIASLKNKIREFEDHMHLRIKFIRRELEQQFPDNSNIHVIRKNDPIWFTNTYSHGNPAGKVVLTLWWGFQEGWIIQFLNADETNMSHELRKKVEDHCGLVEGIKFILPEISKRKGKEIFKEFSIDTEDQTLIEVLVRSQNAIIEALK